ncbi:UNVERIFIED_CONTAM: hypothetical protein NCL1_15443 [Trichonephila clavipes]
MGYGSLHKTGKVFSEMQNNRRKMKLTDIEKDSRPKTLQIKAHEHYFELIIADEAKGKERHKEIFQVFISAGIAVFQQILETISTSDNFLSTFGTLAISKY